MNKKLQSIETQIQTATSKYNHSLQQYQDTIDACDKEIIECKDKMNAAAEKDDFKTFEIMSTRKEFLENKKQINEIKKSKLDKSVFMDNATAEKLIKQMQNVLDDREKETKKKVADLIIQARELSAELQEEIQSVESMQLDIKNFTGLYNSVNVEECRNASRWAYSLGSSAAFQSYVNNHPEYKK